MINVNVLKEKSSKENLFIKMHSIVVILLVFLAFTIGLNLGLHGIIFITWTSPSDTITTDPSTATTTVTEGETEPGTVRDSSREFERDRVWSERKQTSSWTSGGGGNNRKTVTASSSGAADHGGVGGGVDGGVGGSTRSRTNLVPTPPQQQQQQQTKQQQVFHTSTAAGVVGQSNPADNNQKTTSTARRSNMKNPQQLQAYYEKRHNKTWQSVQERINQLCSSLLLDDHTTTNKQQLQQIVSQSLYQHTPIVLLAANRPELLDQTIQSLLQVDDVTKEKILVVQDGTMREVEEVIRRHGLVNKQNTHHLRTHADGGGRIAQHYKYALTTAFDYFPTAQGLIIVEDDLLFAPDFYHYLTTTAATLLTKDETTTFVISAWNDNGFKGHVHDPYRLMRTDYFPGLGWLLPRKLFMEVNDLLSIFDHYIEMRLWMC